MRSLQLCILAALAIALLGTQWDRVEEYFQGTYMDSVAEVAVAYCQAPQSLRALFRELIDEAAAPNKIYVECAADAL